MMGRLKEAKLNHLETYEQDVITGFMAKEESFMDRLFFRLEEAVEHGWIDRDYAMYLIQRPCEAVEWLHDYYGIDV